MKSRTAAAIMFLLPAFAAGIDTAKAESNTLAEAPASVSAEATGVVPIEETWARVAPEMGKHLPMAVDDKTTWLTVKNDGPILVSTFRKDLPKAEIVAVKAEMERDAVENTCRGTQRGKELLDAGGVVRQIFYDRDGALAVTIDVDSKACRED